ncbi:MAG TPA: N,N-dimethylformamidase beta subunit family domain-containing protein [Chloroflexota bacterium]|nr:N,N-dimethylformamidase beta subunit family domain-containing protein [Chloroflexota bacterium]
MEGLTAGLTLARAGLSRLVFGPLLLLLIVAGAAHPVGATRAAALNPIQAENALPGTTSWEVTSPSYHDEVEGYASRQSVYPGQTIRFSVRTTAPRFRLEIFRMGWYGGKGARLVFSQRGLTGHAYPIPTPNPKTGLLVCHWPAALSLQVPRSWVTGIYLVKLSASNHHQAYIPFVVKEAQPRAPLVFVDTVATSEAYNFWGGKSLYVDVNAHSPQQQYERRAVEVSFQRPLAQNMGAGWFFSWEVHLVRWLERNGYDVAYVDDLDVNDDPGLLLHRKAILITGHDEYWSLAMRNAMDAAVAHGVSLGNLAANTGYWQIRFQRMGRNPDGIEICYKSFKRDPMHRRDPRLTTVTWRDPHVNRPESELLGAMYEDYLGNGTPFPWKVTAARRWAVFKRAGVRPGTIVAKLVGPEEDAVLHGYPHPAGLHILARSPVTNSTGERRVSESTEYRAKSGAIVFDAGTIDWSQGLDVFRQPNWSYEPARKQPSAVIERVTANLLSAFEANTR